MNEQFYKLVKNIRTLNSFHLSYYYIEVEQNAIMFEHLFVSLNSFPHTSWNNILSINLSFSFF